MRILHTSDWHLGAAFHDVDRGLDEDEALDGLVTLCRDRAVDAVIVAGDVFDIANPGAEDLRRYYRCLVRLVEEAGVASVVVLAGNHDSGARLEGPRELLAACRVQVLGTLPLEAGPEHCLMLLRGRDGRDQAVCAAVPYLREGDLRMELGDDGLAARQARAMQVRYTEINACARARAQELGLPLVVAGHAFVRGGGGGGGERPVLGAVDVVGNLGQVDAACLAEGAAYAAFGHLHRPQMVAGRAHWRYSGCLLPTGFDETAGSTGVVVVELDAPAPARCEAIPLSTRRRYAALSGNPTVLRESIARLVPAAVDEPTPLLMCSVRLDQPHQGIAQEVVVWAQAVGWRSVRTICERAGGGETGAGEPASPANDLRELEPEAVLRSAYSGRHDGQEPDGELLAAFQTLCAELAGTEA